MKLRLKHDLLVSSLVLFMLLVSAVRMEAKKRGDLVVMKNGDRLTGEVKKLENGILYVETDYFSGSIGLDWSQVDRLRSSASFQLLLKDGSRVEGTVSETRLDKTGEQFVTREENQKRVTPKSEVVEIHSHHRSFWSQVDGSIDLGYSFTSGNQQSSLTSEARASYLSTIYFGGANYTASFGSQKGATASTLFEVQSLDGL